MRVLKIFESKIVQIFCIIIILFIASYLRLWKISGYMTFLGDEGRDVLIVKRMIVDHKFTLLGPTASVGGFFLGPVYYYFMLPFLWLWKLDPTGPAVMVALFGIVTTYLVYLVGKEFFHPYAGITAASLYAVSPLVIAYSRSSWNPNLVPFFALLMIYMLWKSTKEPYRYRYFLLAGISMGIGVQLHYLFLFLYLVCGVWYFLYGRLKKLLYRYMALIFGYILGLSLYLAFEIRHGFPNTQTIFRFIFSGGDTGFSIRSFITIISDVLFRLFGRLLLRFPQPEMLSKIDIRLLAFWNSIVYTLILGSILALVLYLSKKNRNEINNIKSQNFHYSGNIMLLWLFIPLLLFGLYHKGIYDYYFGIFFPLPFLLVGFLCYILFQNIWGGIVSLIIWMSLFIFNWQGMPFQYLPNNQLSQTKTIAKAVYEKTDGKPFNFALITGGNSDHAYRYFFEIWGNPPKTIENNVNDPQRKTVTDQLLVLCERSDCQPLGHALWEIAGFGRAEIDGSWTVSYMTIYRLKHYNEPI